MITLEEALQKYLSQYPSAEERFNDLCGVGNLYLMGGVLRQFREKKKILEPGDVNIIVDVKDEEKWKEIIEQYADSENPQGGHRFNCGELVMDVRSIPEIWAFKERAIMCLKDEYIKLLPETVFLNLDSIVYDWSEQTWSEKKYRKAKRYNVIDVVLRKNPEIMLNIVRAYIFKQRYDMTISEELTEMIEKQRSSRENFVEELMRIQEEKYNEIIVDFNKVW